MRICINATNVIHGTRAIRRYTTNLIKNLIKIDNENEYIIFYNIFRKGFNRVLSFNEAKNIKTVMCRIPGRILSFLWNNFDFPDIEKYTEKLDIYHATDFDIIRTKSGKIVFTLHSLSYLKTPQFYTTKFYKLNKYLLEIVLKKCDFIISVSETTKKELLEIYPDYQNKTRTIPLGVCEEFYPREKEITDQILLNKFNIKKPYLLYVGALGAHKGIDNLLYAFNMLKTKIKIEHKLVLVGEKGIYYKNLMQLLNKLKLEKDVLFTGYIEQENDDLAYIYSGAEIFIFPSFYEGWASPPLEAMACGVPVITSGISSLPETVGDAAVLVNPESIEEIYEAVKSILFDTEKKNGLIKKGFDRVKQFTWEKIAIKTLKYYESMY